MMVDKPEPLEGDDDQAMKELCPKPKEKKKKKKKLSKMVEKEIRGKRKAEKKNEEERKKKKEEKKNRKELRTKKKEDSAHRSLHSFDTSLRVTHAIETIVKDVNKGFDPTIVKPEDLDSEGEQPIGYQILVATSNQH